VSEKKEKKLGICVCVFNKTNNFKPTQYDRISRPPPRLNCDHKTAAAVRSQQLPLFKIAGNRHSPQLRVSFPPLYDLKFKFLSSITSFYLHIRNNNLLTRNH
jgi:hypothetical protein